MHPLQLRRLCNTHVLEQRPLPPEASAVWKLQRLCEVFPLGAAARSPPSPRHSDWAAASGVLKTASSLKKPVPPSASASLSLYCSPSCGCIAFLSLCCLDTHIYIYIYIFFFAALYEPVPCLCMTLVAQFMLNCSEWNNLALGSGSSCCWDEYRKPNDLKPRALFSCVLYAVFIFACGASACVTKWLTIKLHPLVWTVFISRWASLWLFSPGFTVIAYTGSSLLLFFNLISFKIKQKKS